MFGKKKDTIRLLPQEWKLRSSEFRTLSALVTEPYSKLKRLKVEHLVESQDCSCTGRGLSFFFTQSHLLLVKIGQDIQGIKFLYSNPHPAFSPPWTLDTYLEIILELNKLA